MEELPVVFLGESLARAGCRVKRERTGWLAGPRARRAGLPFTGRLANVGGQLECGKGQRIMEQEIAETGAHIGGVTFGTFLLDALIIFFFVVWFWILIRVLMDLFRRKDISGVTKVLWVIFMVVLPYLGIFAYLLTQGWGMEDRDVAQAKQTREALREAVGFSVADEIGKLEGLKAEGKITDAEFQKLRAKLV